MIARPRDDNTAEHMRICLASGLFPPVIGGEEKHTAVLAGALVRAGHTVCVVTQRCPGSPRREVRDGVQVARTIRSLSGSPFFGLTYSGSLAWFLLRHARRFDIIQATYMYWDAVTAALLKPWLRARLVARVVVGGPGGDIDRFRRMRLFPRVARWDRPALDRLVSMVIRRADGFIVLNDRTRGELLGLGVAPERCTVVANGVEVPAKWDARPVRTGVPRLLSVARLEEQKGLDILIRALPAVRAHVGQLELILVGDGPARERLRALAAGTGVGDAVRFEGLVQDVGRYLAAADIFVLPSRFEGLPLALLEAMAVGLPVVATAVPGNTDVIRDGRDGLLVPRDDPQALAAALVRVLRDPALAAGLGEGARRRVSADFSVGVMVERTLAVYRQVLKGAV